VGRIRIQTGCRAAVTGKFVVVDFAGVVGLVDAVAASGAIPGCGRILVAPDRLAGCRSRASVARPPAGQTGDEEARPSGPVLRDLRHLAGEVAAV
jgi:hypothetical protein